MLETNTKTKNKYGLTEKEIEVLNMLTTNKNISEIADHFHNTFYTIKTHIVRIHRKMESSNRGHCVYLGIKEGLIKI
jgi:DNA-binding NarL/FixJ family response regulator